MLTQTSRNHVTHQNFPDFARRQIDFVKRTVEHQKITEMDWIRLPFDSSSTQLYTWNLGQAAINGPNRGPSSANDNHVMML